MQEITLKVLHMNCKHCTDKIEGFVKEVNGIKEVICSLPTQEVKVTFETPATQEQIIEAIQDCGFEVC